MSIAVRSDSSVALSAPVGLPLPATKSRPCVTFIIPAHNEAATIGDVLRGIQALALDVQILVVDDGSTDNTADAAEAALSAMNGLVIRQCNLGKGAAVRAALPFVDGEIVVIQDADMEYDPRDVPRLIDPILHGAADVVYGSRLSGGQPQRAYMFWHLVGNRFLSLVTNILFNTTISDMETGYKAFRAQVLLSLCLRQNDFRIEPEITSQICLRKFRVYEVPIAYYGRTFDEGKKITWRDGFRALGVLVAARVRGTPTVIPAAQLPAAAE